MRTEDYFPADDLVYLRSQDFDGRLAGFNVRAANARFIAKNLLRDSEVRRDRGADVTFLELMKEPLGRHDERRLAQLPASTRRGRRRTA